MRKGELERDGSDATVLNEWSVCFSSSLTKYNCIHLSYVTFPTEMENMNSNVCI